MGKLFNADRNPEGGYMMRLSHAIAEHPGVAVGLTLLMLVWFGVGGFAMQDASNAGGAIHPSSSHGSFFSMEELLFWGAAAGALLTLVGGWSWFHSQMAPVEETGPAAAEKLGEEIQRFKQEGAAAKREERLKRLQQTGGKPTDSDAGKIG